MILADTSIWGDHLRRDDPQLRAFLERGEVLTHPFVIGELALGGLGEASAAMRSLRDLPQSARADDSEVLHFIAAKGLAGRGVGWVDAHLLASVALTPGARLWSRDRSLGAAAVTLGLGEDRR